LERFVRFLDKDKLGRINYMDFLGKVCKVSNKNHNPFKSVISRLSYFLTQNKISSGALLKRLASASSQNTSAAPGIIGIPTNLFAEFLKQKVEKKRNLEELCNYSNMIDVDKDGFVTEADIETCIKNLPNMAFFRNGGAALTQSTFNSQNKIFPKASKLSKEKALSVCKQIRDALAVKRMQYRDAFNKFDIDKDNMVSFAEFNRGMVDVCDLSVPVKEQIYSLMDKNSIGLISYDQFLDVLRQENLEK
jgi:Ca2+-binding EF-hand superfamily protein